MVLRLALTVMVLLKITLANGGVNRSKRSLLDLGILVECTANQSLDLVGYGCYCGAGDKGGNPMDALDECCMHHDHCYDDVMKNKNCGGSLTDFLDGPYFTRYEFDTDCKHKEIKCKDKEGTCPRYACDCDRSFALCVAESIDQYSKAYSRKKMDYSWCKKGMSKANEEKTVNNLL